MSLYNKMSNIDISELSSLLEAYNGKPKEFIRCEKLLSQIINQIHEDNTEMYDLVRERNVDKLYPQNKELCNIFEKYFNVDKVNIYWQSGVINAKTLAPNSFAVPKYKNKMMSNKPSDLKMYIIINEDLVTKCNLTPQELMGVILHEIGHNFYTCPIMIISTLILLITTFPVGIIVDFVAKSLYKISFELVDFTKRELPLLYNAIDAVFHVLTEFRQYVKPIEMAMHVTLTVADVIRNPSMKLNLGAYGNEKGADSFAAKYGYGPDIARALEKMATPMDTSYARAITKAGGGWSTFASVMDDLCTLSLDLVAGITMDPHPNVNQRTQALLVKLEDDLRTGDYPPEAKKELENEIKRMRKVYQTVNDPKYGGSIHIRKSWYHMIDGLTKGHSDIREIFNFYFDSFRF